MTEERPPWITSKEGTHPAFKKLSDEEMEDLALAAIAEARRLGEGQGMLFLTEDQKFLLDAERRRIHHKSNAELFEEMGDKEQEIAHRQWWSEAAIDLGQFDEAKAALRGRNRRIADKTLDKTIATLRRAVERPDTDECHCERETVETEKGAALALDRRYAVRRIFSPVHNKIITLYRCRHCGFTNATDAPPERQANYEANRKVVETTARIARAKGDAIPRGAPDAQILKA